MFHKLRIPAFALLWVSVGCAWAQNTALSERDIEGFMSAYRVVDGAREVVSEMLQAQVDNGKLSVEMATCISNRLPSGQIKQIVTPVLQRAFSDSLQLRSVTDFFNSSTGRRLTDGSLVMLRETMWRKLHGLPDIPFGWPASFKSEDMRLVDSFGRSEGGKAFNQFVEQWLPQIPRQNLVSATLDKCANDGVVAEPSQSPGLTPPEEALLGQWRHELQVRVQDGRVLPPQVGDGALIVEFAADGNWTSSAPNNKQRGIYRWIDGDQIEQVTQESAIKALVGAVGTRQLRVDANRLELVSVTTREQLDKLMPSAKPGEVRPNKTVIVNVFRRVKPS